MTDQEPPPALASVLAAPREGGRAWRHAGVDREGWEALVSWLAIADWQLVSLWGEPDRVHLALFDAPQADLAIVTLDCPDGRFPSVAAVRPGAQRLERAARDLHGLIPEGLDDDRPWLHHGGPYPFRPAEGESLHQIPVGPVHAGIIEPGHFRFHAQGEVIVRLEARLGYTHKGTEALMAGAGLTLAARLAGRVSGDSTVAYALAFARAAEEAAGIAVPERAVWLRALMAELERLANHFGDIGAICNDASFIIMQARCSMLRERVLQAAAECFGHRLMMDRVVPGGVAADLDESAAGRLSLMLGELQRRFAPLVRLYDRTASLQDRMVSTGRVDRALADAYAAGGFVGRAVGRFADARANPGYPPYDALAFEVPVLTEGDVNARVWVRIREVGQSLALIGQILERLPAGPILAPPPGRLPGGAREGLALAEAFRGDVLAYVRLSEDGRVERCHLRDPSWFQWPLLEKAVEGNIVADFPLCNKSFNCSYSGQDL